MEWLAIDQDLHNSSETLEEPPAAELDAAQEPASNCRPRRSPVAWIIGIAALALGGTLVFESMPPEGNRQTQATQAAPVPVTVVEASTRDVPIYLDGLGTVQAINTVAIRTQVDGKLQSVNFVEGQQVHKGDTLAVSIRGPAGGARSGQGQARRGRGAAVVRPEGPRPLSRTWYVKGAGTQQAVDQQQAKVDNLKATIEADQAAIESAETQLELRHHHGADRRPRRLPPGRCRQHRPCRRSTPITVLTQIKPAMVDLHAAAEQSRRRARGDAARHGRGPRLRPGQHARARDGTLMLIDNQIDQTTSTISLKASFPNEDERLWPGEFVRVRVLVER